MFSIINWCIARWILYWSNQSLHIFIQIFDEHISIWNIYTSFLTLFLMTFQNESFKLIYNYVFKSSRNRNRFWIWNIGYKLLILMNEWMKPKRTEHYLTICAKEALQIFSLFNKFSRAFQLITVLIGAGQTLDKHKGEAVLTSLDCTQFSRTYMNTTHFYEVV